MTKNNFNNFKTPKRGRLPVTHCLSCWSVIAAASTRCKFCGKATPVGLRRAKL